jgi:proline utilization trans-activator
LAHEFAHQSPALSERLLFDGTTYELGWDGSRVVVGPDTSALPSFDYAIYLINLVKFHCSQVFHLFDEESFIGDLYKFYEDPAESVARADLFYIHLLLIFAFGKAVTHISTASRRPLGCDFFVKALQLLPDVSVLSKQPAVAAEILCCIALYYQCLDYRGCAYNFVSVPQGRYV